MDVSHCDIIDDDQQRLTTMSVRARSCGGITCCCEVVEDEGGSFRWKFQVEVPGGESRRKVANSNKRGRSDPDSPNSNANGGHLGCTSLAHASRFSSSSITVAICHVEFLPCQHPGSPVEPMTDALLICTANLFVPCLTASTSPLEHLSCFFAHFNAIFLMCASIRLCLSVGCAHSSSILADATRGQGFAFGGSELGNFSKICVPSRQDSTNLDKSIRILTLFSCWATKPWASFVASVNTTLLARCRVAAATDWIKRTRTSS